MKSIKSMDHQTYIAYNISAPILPIFIVDSIPYGYGGNAKVRKKQCGKESILVNKGGYLF